MAQRLWKHKKNNTTWGLVLKLSTKLTILCLFCPVLTHCFSSNFQRTNNVFLSQQINVSQISAKRTAWNVECYIHPWMDLRECSLELKASMDKFLDNGTKIPASTTQSVQLEQTYVITFTTFFCLLVCLTLPWITNVQRFALSFFFTAT
jgi:hypothetical protein